ncbi:winged helix-turn-helix domain-containing protein [Thalassotalea castellviae]|uniref:Winged helix-turn-helix domain-containing protein n=1 Tax=Thalassotalea castellviae TaxID=3075612 RepID=A0ABU3A478_9GAMM|nr:winged helix-turn-helix domain-containing protein [Thalassotalea sp. W431]MDT0604710.1 winged helix-turn-helix domain-containing protein [Thalassotalea sp. W431]
MAFVGGEKFELGPYLVLPEHNKLVVDGKECKVEPKIMAVLCYLIANKGEVVSREQIAETLWPNTVTGLEVVTRAIFELRKILKDDPKQPRYIETIARKGYCFIYDLSEIKRPSVTENAVSSTPPIDYKNTVVWGVLIAILIALFYWFQDIPTKSTSFPSQTSFLTDIDVFADSPAISPDGKSLLFTKKSHFKERYNELTLLDIDSHKQTVINTGSSFKLPLWLANSQSWYYVKCPQRLKCEVVEHNIATNEKSTLYTANNMIISLALSLESQQLFLSVLTNNRIQLKQIDLNSQHKLATTIELPETANPHLLLFKDLNTLFVAATVSDGITHLYRYDMNKKAFQLITKKFSRLYGMSLKDEKSLWVAGELAGQKGLWSFNVNNYKIETAVNSLPDHTPMLVTSPLNQQSLIYKNNSRTINIERVGNIDIPKMDKVNSSLIDMNAFYSPKNKTLYFSSNRNGLYDIWKFDGGNVERVTNIKANMIDRPIIGPQGNTLAFVARTKLKSELTLFDLSGEKEIKRLLLPNKIFLLSWSYDEKFIYFSTYEDEQYNIYKFNVLTFEKEKILLNAGAIAQESVDGNYLYYGDMEKAQLMRKSKEGQVDVMFKIPLEDIKGIRPNTLKVIDETFYYIGTLDNKTVLKQYSFIDQTLKVHTELPNDIYVTDITKGEEIGVIFDRFSKMNSKLIYLQ